MLHPLRIAIDAHSVGARLGGNETYAINLIEALAEIDQTNLYTLYVTKREAIARFANRWPNFTVKQTLPHTPLVRIPLTLSRELRRHPVTFCTCSTRRLRWRRVPSLPRFTIWRSSTCLRPSTGAVGCNYA